MHNFFPLPPFSSLPSPPSKRVSVYTMLCTLAATLICKAGDELERRSDWAEYFWTGGGGKERMSQSFSRCITSPVPFLTLDEHFSQHNGPLGKKLCTSILGWEHLSLQHTYHENSLAEKILLNSMLQMVYWGEDQQPWTGAEPQVLVSELPLTYTFIFLPYTLRKPLVSTTENKQHTRFLFFKIIKTFTWRSLHHLLPTDLVLLQPVVTVTHCVAQLTGSAGLKPSLPARPPRPWSLGRMNATRTQVFMKRDWREISFQRAVSARFPVLFKHIYESFCIPVTPCGSYLDCSLSKSQY